MTSFHLELQGSGPLHRRVYGALLGRVRSGALPPGARLPSTRALAEALGVSRTPVLHAYEQLLAEGWLEARRGSGTRVATSVRAEHSSPGSRPTRARTPRPGRPVRRLQREVARSRFHQPHPAHRALRFDLRFGACDPADAPDAVWRRLLAAAARGSASWRHRYEHAAGLPTLREAIAAHLTRARGVRCEASQVVVTSGTQQALDLLARILIEAGDSVWIEDPGHLGARLAFRAAGAELRPLHVDARGVSLDRADPNAPARAYYVTPSHQFPLGATLPLERRQTLLQRARRAGAWVIEDDYDGEFRYGGAPIPSLQGLDPDARVIYLGGFSKTLMPSLRIGFAVLPPDLVEPFVALKAIADGGNPALEQHALAALLSEGHYARHLKRVARRHAERRVRLLESLQRELDVPFVVAGAAAGLHVALRLPQVPGSREAALVSAAAEHGVGVSGTRRYFLRNPRHVTLLLGHASVPAARMPAAARALAAAWGG